MRRAVPFVVALLVLLGACGSSDDRDDAATVDTKPAGATTTAPNTPTSFEVEITSTTSAGGTTTTAPNAAGEPSGKILMVKIYVGPDLAAAHKFYGAVLGSTKSGSVGDTVDIVSFPDGGPGALFIKEGKDDRDKYGAIVAQVPDLEAAKAAALANGATEQGTFGGNPGGQAAKSVDVLDPWGNQIEILQLG